MYYNLQLYNFTIIYICVMYYIYIYYVYTSWIFMGVLNQHPTLYHHCVPPRLHFDVRAFGCTHCSHDAT